MADPACKDCRYFLPGYRGTHGECRDPSKRIFPRYCTPSWASMPTIADGDTFTCTNWAAPEKVEAR